MNLVFRYDKTLRFIIVIFISTNRKRNYTSLFDGNVNIPNIKKIIYLKYKHYYNIQGVL